MEQQEYKTKDLHEAALLYADGVKLVDVEGVGKTCWFVFDNKSECEKISKLYWAGDAEVKAKAYSDALRTLKDRLFANK